MRGICDIHVDTPLAIRIRLQAALFRFASVSFNSAQAGLQAVGINNLSEMHYLAETAHQGGVLVCQQSIPFAEAVGADLSCDDLGAFLLDRVDQTLRP